MNVLPVIVREVREQARQNFTYSLRILGFAVVLAALVLAILGRGLLPGRGGQIFTLIHTGLLISIWLLVPLSVSDCLSRERRDGTLGLLFLTTLGATDIVFAKAAAHGLRALTLWLAALPVMVIPFLVGGLNWLTVVLSCSINFSSIMLALAGSVFASSCCKQRHRSLALAMMIAVFLLTTYGLMFIVIFVVGLGPGPAANSWQRIWNNLPPIELAVPAAFAVLSGAGDTWSRVASIMPAASQRAAFIGAGAATLVSLLASCVLMLIAAHNVRRRWQEASRSAHAEKLERVFCTPVLGQTLLQRWMRWKLDRNPIGWLEQRKWSGRLVMWIWLAVLVSFYSTVLSERGFFMRSFPSLQSALAWLLLVSIAATAAGSFRRERESGVLELLLVSPLNSMKILGGRVRGVWGQFAPAVMLLFGVWLFASTFIPAVRAKDATWFCIAFLTVPIVGLYFSLAKTHYLSAFMWTMLVGYAIPTLLANISSSRLSLLQTLGLIPVAPPTTTSDLTGPIWGAIQIVLASGFAWLLYRNLEQRRFALELPAG